MIVGRNPGHRPAQAEPLPWRISRNVQPVRRGGGSCPHDRSGPGAPCPRNPSALSAQLLGFTDSCRRRRRRLRPSPVPRISTPASSTSDQGASLLSGQGRTVWSWPQGYWMSASSLHAAPAEHEEARTEPSVCHFAISGRAFPKNAWTHVPVLSARCLVGTALQSRELLMECCGF